MLSNFFAMIDHQPQIVNDKHIAAVGVSGLQAGKNDLFLFFAQRRRQRFRPVDIISVVRQADADDEFPAQGRQPRAQ